MIFCLRNSLFREKGYNKKGVLWWGAHFAEEKEQPSTVHPWKASGRGAAELRMRNLISTGRFAWQKETFLSGWGSPVHTLLTAASIQNIHGVEIYFPGLHLLVKKELNCISWIAFFRSGCEWAWFLSYVFLSAGSVSSRVQPSNEDSFFGRNKTNLLINTGSKILVSWRHFTSSSPGLGKVVLAQRVLSSLGKCSRAQRQKAVPGRQCPTEQCSDSLSPSLCKWLIQSQL